MDTFTVIAASLGAVLAYQVINGSKPVAKQLEGYPAENISLRRGNKHYTIALQNMWTRKTAMENPNFWRKSRTFSNQMNQSLGSKDARSRFNLHFTRLPNAGELPPLINRKIKL